MCGWQLITLGIFAQLLIITYGELEGRRRAKTGRHNDPSPGDDPPTQHPGPRHRAR
ncbi:MAG: hypothetical protein ACRDRZ_13025 [Pseudonocardiaceae bacterium]